MLVLLFSTYGSCGTNTDDNSSDGVTVAISNQMPIDPASLSWLQLWSSYIISNSNLHMLWIYLKYESVEICSWTRMGRRWDKPQKIILGLLDYKIATWLVRICMFIQG